MLTISETIQDFKQNNNKYIDVLHTPYKWGYGSTPRTAALRNNLYWKAAVVKDFINLVSGLAKCEFRNGQHIRIDVDRAKLFTESFCMSEGEPVVLRHAKAMLNVCDKLPIYIKPGELIVGCPNSAPDELRWYPEINAAFMVEAITTGGFTTMVSSEERDIILDICNYWRGRSVADKIRNMLPEQIFPDITGGLISSPIEAKLWEMGMVGLTFDYPRLFEEGIVARIERANNHLQLLYENVCDYDPADFIEKRMNWEAMVIAGKAILRFAERYCLLAETLAKNETNPSSKKELENLAEILSRVPACSARTLHEAIQFYWIVEVAAKFIAVYGTGGGHRIDQIFWPYYQSDIDAKRINRSQALELIECLFLKIQEVGIALEWPVTFTGKAGGDIFYTLNVAGTNEDRSDATNDLSYIVLEAMSNLHINHPPIAVRYHKGISPEFVEQAIDLARIGMGHPSWFNEDLLEKWALMRGYSPRDAKKTAVGGCVTNNVPGRYMLTTGAIGIGGIILPKVLEEVLFQGGNAGKAERPDKPHTKDPRDMQSADDILEAFIERNLFYARQMTNAWNITQAVLMAEYPNPAGSFLLDEPLELGIDLKKAHKQYDTYPAIFSLGAITVADSLSAIQKVIFEEKRYSMDQLINALIENWKGHESMRQYFLNAPKYGNDDEFADSWAVKVSVKFEEAISQIKDAWGSTLLSDGGTAAGYQTVGLACRATPDGRFAMNHLTDGSRSPMAGADKKGPTAVLNSAAKIPFLRSELFNQRFQAHFLEGENKALFANYLKAWFDKGTIPHIQFNVIDSEILRDAQARPLEYTDLQVRVAGYCAFWIDLPKGTQDSIIARTEHCF